MAVKQMMHVSVLLAMTWAAMVWAEAPATTQPAPEIAYSDVAVAGGPWKVWFKPHLVDRKTYVFRFDLLEIASPDMKVSFNGSGTWCVYRIFHRDHLVDSPTGGTGSVVYWDGKPVGTVHGGEVTEEVTLKVDGQTIAVVRAGKPQYERLAKWGGSRITISKKSMIGPFRHEAIFEFGADQNSYVVTHRYEAAEPVPADRFKGYRYVFMQMMPPEFSEWMRIGADRQVTIGHTDTDPKVPAKDRTLWQERIQSLTCYAPAWNAGVTYAYPEAYEGLSHLVDRGRKDRKFRGILFTKDAYAAGEVLQWRLRVSVFDATNDTWQSRGRAVAEAPFQVAPASGEAQAADPQGR